MAQTIVVLGSTGAQGGSVAKYLATKGYQVLAGTRNPDGDAAKAIKSDNITPVKVDLEDKEQLTSVFKQADLLFAVTNFWGLLEDKRGPIDAEVAQARNIIHAAKAAGIKHMIFSTLESAKTISGGKVPVGHFDSKGLYEEDIKTSGVPYTLLRTVFYYQNFVSFFPIKEDGLITLPMKDEKLSFYDVTDTGGIVYGILSAGDKYKGQTLGVTGDEMTVADIAKVLTEEVSGREFKYNKVTAEQFAAFGFPGAEELANMFLFFTDFPFERDLAHTKTLYPGLKDFRTYVKDNVDAYKLQK